MPTMAEIASEVASFTGRPDQRAWAQFSVLSLIKDMVKMADFSEDLYETEFFADSNELEFKGPCVIEMPDLSTFTHAPNYTGAIRKFAYLVYGNQKLTEVTPHNLLLAGCPEQDIFYRNGDKRLVINSSGAFKKLRVGVYAVPIALAEFDGETHWLLEEASEILTIGAIAKVYKNTGDDASHDRFFQEYNILKRAFKLDRVNSGVI